METLEPRGLLDRNVLFAADALRSRRIKADALRCLVFAAAFFLMSFTRGGPDWLNVLCAFCGIGCVLAGICMLAGESSVSEIGQIQVKVTCPACGARLFADHLRHAFKTCLCPFCEARIVADPGTMRET
jgi:hypothetical protein